MLRLKLKWKRFTLLLKAKGVYLSKPSTYSLLFRLTWGFFRRHGFKGAHRLSNKLNETNDVNVGVFSKGGTKMTYLEKITPVHSEFRKIRKAVESFRRQPSFTFIILNGDAEFAYETINSIRNLIYPQEKISILRVHSEFVCNESNPHLFPSLKAAYESASGDYVMLLREGEIVSRNLLFECICMVQQEDNLPEVICFDCDYLSKGQRIYPKYKSGWSPARLIHDPDYLDRACLLLRCCCEPNDDPDTIIFQAMQRGSVLKIDGILVSLLYKHRTAIPSGNIRRDIPVSVILHPDSIRMETEKYMEQLVQLLPNGSEIFALSLGGFITSCFVDPKFKKYGCEIVKVAGTNVCAAGNRAVEKAKHEVLIFLSGDTLPEDGTISRLSEAAMEPASGPCGATLINRRDRIVSGGLIYDSLGSRWVHGFAGERIESTCNYHALQTCRNVLAVSEKLFSVNRKKLQEAGCFDFEETAFTNAVVKLCLKMREKGYPAVFVPESFAVTGEVTTPDISYGIKKDPNLNSYLKLKETVPVIDREPVRVSLAGAPTISREEIKKILLVKLDHIGDGILGIPAIRKVRREFPNAEITLLCAPWLKEIMENQPEVNRVGMLRILP
jgi:hypothetical protein